MIERLFISGIDYEQEVKPLINSFTKKNKIDVKKVEQLINFDDYSENEILSKFANSIIIDTTFETIQVTLYTETSKYSIKVAVLESDPKSIRNQLLRTIYQVFLQANFEPLPWGILTGIRPTKLILDLINNQASDDEIIKHMSENYFVSLEKIKLGIMIAKKEKGILDELNIKDTFSLYVGVPFCPSICNYCSFSSYPYEKFGFLEEDYVNALCTEIEETSKIMDGKKPITVYFGGGTPTTIKTENLRKIIRKVRECFDLSLVKEFCVEAGRADTITYEKLVMLKEEKVNRISINPQSMNDKTLELIGRKHTTKQVIDAYNLAKEAGFSNINMDIILGLSGESPEFVKHTLEEIKKLNPPSLTVHTLAKKRAAKLTYDNRAYEGLEATNVLDMFDLSYEFSKKQGYEPYYLYRQKNMAENLENIGYAKSGYECFYNILIMEDIQSIVALGPGAVTKRVFDNGRIERCDNVKDVKQFIDRIDEMISRKKELFELN